MKIILFLFVFFPDIYFVNGIELVIKKIEMRVVKKNDIGFYFDATIINVMKENKETLQFTMRSDKCCLEMTNQRMDCDMSKLYGGDFGQIVPGEIKTVTLVYPTLTLHNRVGYCDIQLNSYHSNGNKIKMAQRITFNTTISQEYVADNLLSLVSGQNLTNCKTLDLNPLKNCVPENCEEKYFGQRNFFNLNTMLCDKVPDCSLKKHMIYDFINNECVNTNQILTENDLMRLKNGEFDNNEWKDNNNKSRANVYDEFMKQFEHIYPAETINANRKAEPASLLLFLFVLIVLAILVYCILSSCLICLLIVTMYPKRAKKYACRNSTMWRRPPTDTSVTTSSAGTRATDLTRQKANKYKQLKLSKKYDGINSRKKCPHVSNKTHIQYNNPSYNTMGTTTVVQNN